MTSSLADRQGDRIHSDEGGVWIKVTLVLGFLFYVGMIIMVAAGFTAMIPVVIVPVVVVALVGAGNLMGGRSHGRRSGQPARAVGAPVSSSGPNEESVAE